MSLAFFFDTSSWHTFSATLFEMSDSDVKDELSSDTSYDKGLNNENAQVDDYLFQQKENSAFTEVTPQRSTIDVQNHPLLNSLVY